MSKREMYARRVEQLCTAGCEVLMLFPRSVIADYSPPSHAELYRIREEVAMAARKSRGEFDKFWPRPPRAKRRF